MLCHTCKEVQYSRVQCSAVPVVLADFCYYFVQVEINLPCRPPEIIYQQYCSCLVRCLCLQYHGGAEHGEAPYRRRLGKNNSFSFLPASPAWLGGSFIWALWQLKLYDGDSNGRNWSFMQRLGPGKFYGQLSYSFLPSVSCLDRPLQSWLPQTCTDNFHCISPFPVEPWIAANSLWTGGPEALLLAKKKATHNLCSCGVLSGAYSSSSSFPLHERAPAAGSPEKRQQRRHGPCAPTPLPPPLLLPESALPTLPEGGKTTHNFTHPVQRGS